MGSTLIWWLLGGAVVVGGAAVWYVTKDGTKKPVAEVCLKDLPKDMFDKVKIALDSKNVAALNAYALEARQKGWICAAGEIEAASVAASKAGGGSGVSKIGPQPGDLVLDPVTPSVTPAPIGGVVSDPDAGALTDCAQAFAYLSSEEQEAIVKAINRYRSDGDPYTLNTIADSFASTGSVLAGCLRSQATATPKSASTPLLPVTVAQMEMPGSWVT